MIRRLTAVLWLAVAVAVALPGMAQVAEPSWIARNPVPYLCYSSKVQVTSQGNVVTADEYAARLYGPAGELSLLWPDAGMGAGVRAPWHGPWVHDAAGSVYVATRRQYPDPFPHGIVVTRHNAEGTAAWSHLVGDGTRESDYPVAVETDPQGDLVVVGVLGESAYDPRGTRRLQDWIVLKLAPNGSVLWRATYGRGWPDYLPEGSRYSTTDVPLGLAIAPSGSIYVLGSAGGMDLAYQRSPDLVLRKYTAAGEFEWEAVLCAQCGFYTGEGPVTRGRLTITSDGCPLVTHVHGGATVTKVSTAGTVLWSFLRDFSAGWYCEVACGGGDVFVTGTVAEADLSGSDLFVAKYAGQSGALLWERVRADPDPPYPAPDREYPVAMVVDDAGNALVVAAAVDVVDPFAEWGGPLYDCRDILTLKYTSDGVPQWEGRVNGPGDFDDWPGGIACDRKGNVYVAGSCATVVELDANSPNPQVLAAESVLIKYANTQPGPSMAVSPAPGVSLVFSSVTAAGETTVTAPSGTPALPANFGVEGAALFEITTSARFAGQVAVGLPYDPANADPRILHWEGNKWKDVTTRVDAASHIVWGTVTGFSPFAVADRLYVPTLASAIDIKPGSYPNSVNLGSNGTVPVAILSSTTFDATAIDPLTVTLASSTVRLKGNGTPMASVADVNEDGLPDLVVHVSTEALQLTATDTQAMLEAWTLDGLTKVTGTDTVRVVP